MYIWSVNIVANQNSILLSISNCAIKLSLAIVSKYRNLKMHSQHFFSVKILESMKLLVSTFDFHSFNLSKKVLNLGNRLNNYPDLSADSIFIFCFHQKLDLPSSPPTTLSFNGISLLSVILFSNFFLIDLPLADRNFNFNLVHSKSTAIANLNVHTCRLLIA